MNRLKIPDERDSQWRQVGRLKIVRIFGKDKEVSRSQYFEGIWEYKAQCILWLCYCVYI